MESFLLVSSETSTFPLRHPLGILSSVLTCLISLPFVMLYRPFVECESFDFILSDLPTRHPYGIDSPLLICRSFTPSVILISPMCDFDIFRFAVSVAFNRPFFQPSGMVSVFSIVFWSTPFVIHIRPLVVGKPPNFQPSGICVVSYMNFIFDPLFITYRFYFIQIYLSRNPLFKTAPRMFRDEFVVVLIFEVDCNGRASLNRTENGSGASVCIHRITERTVLDFGRRILSTIGRSNLNTGSGGDDVANAINLFDVVCGLGKRIEESIAAINIECVALLGKDRTLDDRRPTESGSSRREGDRTHLDNRRGVLALRTAVLQRTEEDVFVGREGAGGVHGLRVSKCTIAQTDALTAVGSILTIQNPTSLVREVNDHSKFRSDEVRERRLGDIKNEFLESNCVTNKPFPFVLTMSP